MICLTLFCWLHGGGKYQIMWYKRYMVEFFL